LIIGDGPYLYWLKKLVNKLNLKNRVVFVGPISDYWLPAYYAATDVVVLPSTSRLEAFGIVGLEGMATAKPLILSDIPGVREVISPEEGFIVEPLDPKAIAEALEKIWSYPEMASQMGKRGRKRVEKLFSWDKVSKDIENIFLELVSK
jgi:glycosyltransferase involved in cell wall biosynthesis